MSYRSDEDAALARVDALEQDLDAARAQIASLKRRLAMPPAAPRAVEPVPLSRDIDDLRPPEERRTRGEVFVIVLLWLVTLAMILWLCGAPR